jgi:T5SS/PEP-CTERM-associated repeat protein
MRRVFSGHLILSLTTLLFAFFLVPACPAAEWGWDETVSTGDFTNPNDWSRLDIPPPPQHGVPQSGDTIVAFNTSAGPITIRCSGNSVAMATLDCNLDLSGGGLTISGSLAGGEGAVGTFAAGTMLFGNGTLSANMLEDNLIVTQGATCKINTTVFPDGTGNATVLATGANSAFNATGDFQGTLALEDQATASVGGILRGGLSLSNAASFTGNALEATVNVVSASFKSTGEFNGDLTITNSGTATLAGTAQGSFTLSSASTFSSQADVQGRLIALGAKFNAGTYGGTLTLSNGSIANIAENASPVGLVNGAGSKLTVGSTLSVTNGDLDFRDGATFSASTVTIGPDVGAFNPDAVLVVDGTNSQGIVKGLVQVGLAANSPGPSYLYVQDGATLTAQALDLGVGSKSSTYATTGPYDVLNHPAQSGGSIQVDGPVRVGVGGQAELVINAGSLEMTNGAPLEIGVQPGSNGTLLAAGDGTTAVNLGASPIFVGEGGPGVFGLGGGCAVNAQGVIQVGVNSTSYLSVDVRTTNSAKLTTGPAQFGIQAVPGSSAANALGNGTVSGTGALWQINGDLVVGAGGSGSLTVQNGGALQVKGQTITLGRDQGSSGLFTLDGTNTHYTFGGKLLIGPVGNGTLDIADGFQLDQSADALTLGGAPGSSGTVRVRNAGSLYKSSDGSIGVQGIGSLLILDNATLQSSGTMTLGGQAGGTGNATLIGPGAKWTISGNLIVGMQGDSNTNGQQGIGTITLTNAASLEVDGSDLILGQNAGGIGNLRIAGKGTQLTFAGQNLYVGQSGAGDLEIMDGAQFGLSAAGGTTPPPTNTVATCQPVPVNGPPGPKNIVGAQAGAIGMVTVSGSDTLWGVNGSLIVGQQGTADQVAQGTVLIQDGASVSVSGSLVTLGQETFGRGRLILQGPGSSLTGGATLEIGRHGDGTLELRDGASNSLPSPILGCLPGSSGTLRVMGSSSNTPSTFESLGSITMGGQSTGSVEVLQGGLLLSSGRAVISRDVTAKGLVTLTDPGSVWRHSSPGSGAGPGLIVVGETGSGLLQITNGATCQSDALAIGGQTGGSGQVQVGSSGSKATLKALFVGSEQGSSNAPPGSGLGNGMLQITGGGTVEVKPDSSGSVVDVASPLNQSNQIQVDNSGQLLATQSTLVLGGPGNSLVNIGPGGAVDTAAGIIGNGFGQATVMLQGNGSAFAAWSVLSQPGLTNRLTVGGSGPGTLLIQQQGQVLLPPSMAGTSIGTVQPGTLQVQGEGAKFDAFDAPLNVGSGAQPGMVMISGGGQVRVGAVNLNGPQGTILTVKDDGSTLTASQSVLVSSGSSLTVDAKGLVSASGTLNIKQATVTVLGDGDIDVGPQLTVLGQTIARTGFGQLRVFGVSGPAGAPTGGTSVVLDQSAVSISQTLSLRSQFIVKNFPFIDKASLVKVQLINSGITVAPGATAPANAVLVNAGGLVTGFGLIVGPNSSTQVLIYRNGGQCDLLPYSLIANPANPSSPSSLNGQLPVAGLLSTSAPVPRPLSASPPSTTNVTSTIFIDGDFQQTTNGILNVTIVGPNPLIDYGVLGVAGTITLAGKLSLNFANGFAPRQGQSFQFVNSSAPPAGQFGSVQITGLAPGFNYQVQANGTSLSLVALNDGVPTSLPAIDIAPAANGLLVSWPGFVQGYTLQTSPSLSAPQWQDLVTSSNQWSVVPTNTLQFFRLTKP